MLNLLDKFLRDLLANFNICLTVFQIVSAVGPQTDANLVGANDNAPNVYLADLRENANCARTSGRERIVENGVAYEDSASARTVKALACMVGREVVFMTSIGQCTQVRVSLSRIL